MDSTLGTLPPAPVAIVGGGPVGLSLALGLARQGMRSILLERKAATSDRSKAPAIHLRSREIFRQWDTEQPLLDAGVLVRSLPLYRAATGRRPLLSFEFSELETEADRPGILFLEQGRTERVLLEAVRETGLCDLRFDSEVVRLVPGDGGVRLTVREEGAQRVLDAEFAVGCDGGGSFVRKALGLPFEGVTLPVRATLADIHVTDGRDSLPWPRTSNDRSTITSTQRLAPRHWRIVRLEADDPRQDGDVSEEEVHRSAAEVLGEGSAQVLWASRFRFQRRTSPRFRVGRVLLAGDAAHIFPPAMGQGMNTGIQDAHNLAWKLAHAVRGGDLERLLASYDVERRDAVGRVSRYVNRFARMGVQAPRFVREGMIQLMRLGQALPRSRRRSLRNMAMIDRGYGASPLLSPTERSSGRRLPNPALRSSGGPEVRLYDLLPNRPVLLDIAHERRFSADPPVKDTLRIGPGAHQDPTGALRGLLGGEDGYILVRPDLHIAWARRGPDGLAEAARHALGYP